MQPRPAKGADESLASVIAGYNDAVLRKDPKANIELEIRLEPVSAEEFIAIKANAGGKYGTPVTTRTVNVVMSEGAGRQMTSNIVTYTHNSAGVAGPREYSKKTRIIAPTRVQRDSVVYRVGLSREEPSVPFQVSANALMRYKVRYSFDVPRDGVDWRLDLTVVKTAHINDGEASLKAIRAAMMGVADGEMPQIADATYEIELELVKARDRLKAADFTVVGDLFALINPDHVQNMEYQRVIYDAAIAVGVQHPSSFLHQRLKQLVPQVKSLNRMSFREIGGFDDWYVTLKLDGERCLLHVVDRACRVIYANSWAEYTVEESMTGVTLVDAERVGDTFHVFDVITVDDERISGDIGARIDRIPAACAEINRRLTPPMQAVPKPYTKIEDPKRDIGAVYAAGEGVENDGLIFSEPGRNYLQTRSYKWKPTEHNTIDFMIMKCPPSLVGLEPYVPPKGSKLHTYLLFVGINHETRTRLGMSLLRGYRDLFPDTPGVYYPVQFSPSVDPLAYIWYSDRDDMHAKIGEFSLVGDSNCADCGWKFHRFRTDRKIGATYYGNDYYVAESIYMNFIDPLTLSTLWGEGDDSTYFTKTADPMYHASNAYKRNVIGAVFADAITQPAQIFDAAAGRGADLSRYRRLGARTLLAVDIDSAAIAELVERKYTRHAGGGRANTVYSAHPGANVGMTMGERTDSNTQIYAAVMDLTTPHAVLSKRCERYGYTAGTATAFVCNFALHYLCGDSATLTNFMRFAASICAVGARCVYTVMDGGAVRKALAGNGKWSVTEGDRLKYHIAYSGRPADGIIEIKLPFTDVLMREPLCDIDLVVKTAGECGFRKVYVKSFTEYAEEFTRQNAAMDSQLTDGDRAYIAMHSVIVLERGVVTTGGQVRKLAAPRRGLRRG